MTSTLEMVRTKSDELAIAEGCYFDLDAAERPRQFMRLFCRHSKGRWAGQPLELLPWQWEDVVKPLFGWMRPNGKRRFTRCYCEVPKKNGKSTLSSGLALYLFVGDGEPGPEVYCAAYSRSQAKIVYGEVERMIRKSPDLNSVLQCYAAGHRITFPEADGIMMALSSEAGVSEGLNIHGLIFDELHTQRTRDLWDVLRDGGAAREQPLTIVITTAGDDRSIVCKEQHDYARGILEGSIIDTSYLPVIYGASKDDPWDDPATWRKANPSVGHTLTIEGLAEDAKQAKVSPSEKAAFQRRRLNIWVESSERWLDLDYWDECEDDIELYEGFLHSPYLGLDLSATTDIVALVMAFMVDDRVAIVPKFWASEGALLKRERENKPRLNAWADQGYIQITEGEVIDYTEIQRAVIDIHTEYQVQAFGVDPWNSHHLCQLLGNEGIHTVQIRQGYKELAPPTKRLEELLLEKRVIHFGNPVMRWMLSNVHCEMDAAGNKKPSRRRSIEKIDGVVALIMALALMGEEMGPSIYEEQGLIVL